MEERWFLHRRRQISKRLVGFGGSSVYWLQSRDRDDRVDRLIFEGKMKTIQIFLNFQLAPP